MMQATKFLFVLAASAMAVSNGNQAKSPVKKVVSMLTDMLAKGKKEKQDETVRFASYKQFCESTSAEKAKNIATGKKEIEQLAATIAKAQADVVEITQYVAGLDSDVATWTDDLKTTTAQRAKEYAEFQAAHKEYVDSIDAVDRAMEVLQKGTGGTKIAQLLQRGSVIAMLQSGSRTQVKSILDQIDPGKALLQEAEEEGITQPNPQAYAYEGSSGGIIDLVEKLGDKFTEEKRALEKAEFNAKSAYEVMQKDLNGQIASATMERGMKETTKSKTLEAEAGAKGDKADTEASLAEDEKFLADLDAECKSKSFDYEQRQIVREGEIEAIDKAIGIMSGDDVAGANAYTMVQKSTSLAQLRSATRNPVQDAVAAFLQQQADKTGSKLLALIAGKANSDPFTKVKKLIREMIQKLMEEANAEATHKGFCDTEMGTNKQTRDKKTAQSEELTADIEELTAEISKLASEITELGEELSAIDAAVAKATEERFAEKAKNAETVSDAKAGAAAVAQALAILKDFYEKAATPVEQPAPQQGPIAYDNRALQILKTASGASFVQIEAHTQGRVPGAPEMESGSYTGMANGGVLGLMEVCQSDFEKLLAETESSEADAARVFDEFQADSAQDKAVKETDQKHKVAEKSTKESDKATAMKDLRITQEELQAAMEYYDKLKPDCEVKVISYAEKKAAREAEIESLKEALGLLVGN